MATKKRNTKIVLDPIDWFQAMDRTFMAQDNIESLLMDLRAITCTPTLKKKIEKAVELLADVYLITAAKYFNTTKPGLDAKSTKHKHKGKGKNIHR